jgi:predicted TIM-barrel fold metal-dependent hydrolase
MKQDGRMIIDAHVNVTRDGKWFDTSHDASTERLLDEMAEAEIDKCLLVAMPFATDNAFIASTVQQYPGRFRGLGYVDFRRTNLEHQVEELYAMGLSGVKLHPRMQGINCLSPDLSTLFSCLNERKSVVMIDSYYQTRGDGVLLENLEPFRYDALVKKYRDVRFIFSHMGGHRVLDAYFLAKSNDNVYLDNSHILRYFAGTSLMPDAAWVMDKLDERVIYGSDFPEYSLGEYLSAFIAVADMNPGVRKDLILSNIGTLIEF